MPEPRPKPARRAAGRARALGQPTRGTTNPNRLRRMDNWIAATLGGALGRAPDPLVIDLGYGASPITAIELIARLQRVRVDVRVIGLEIDPHRVAAAASAADAPRLDFIRGGFELAGNRPFLVRAANVLRQYDESSAIAAWATMRANLAPGGLIVEGTCDETGRRAGWILLDGQGPRSLTLAARLETLRRPSELAERLPKALIHHNVAGQPIHALLSELDQAWAANAALSSFGPRQRWIATCASASRHWPLDRRRARYGELSVAWTAVAPQ